MKNLAYKLKLGQYSTKNIYEIITTTLLHENKTRM